MSDVYYISYKTLDENNHHITKLEFKGDDWDEVTETSIDNIHDFDVTCSDTYEWLDTFGAPNDLAALDMKILTEEEAMLELI